MRRLAAGALLALAELAILAVPAALSASAIAFAPQIYRVLFVGRGELEPFIEAKR